MIRNGVGPNAPQSRKEPSILSVHGLALALLVGCIVAVASREYSETTICLLATSSPVRSLGRPVQHRTVWQIAIRDKKTTLLLCHYRNGIH